MPAPQSIRTAAKTCGLIAIAATAVACGGSSSGGSAAAPAANPPAASSGGSGSTITATETEFKIMLSQTSVKAGSYTIDAANMGKVTHALEINGPGVSDKSTGDIQPGSTSKLTITLAKGSYEIWCPVGNHKMLGMDTHVTVT